MNFRSTERSSFDLRAARRKIISSLSSKSDSAIFSAFGVSPTQQSGRLKYQGKTAEQYAKSVIHSLGESDIKSIANSLGVRIK